MSAQAVTARQGVRAEALRFLYASLAPLTPYMDDPQVTEIMCNGAGQVFVERAGQMVRAPVSLDDVALESAIRAIMASNDKEASPIMDARLEGLRIAAALPPVAVLGPMMSIRRHASRKFPLSHYIDSGAFDAAASAEVAALDGEQIAQRDEAEAAAARGGQGLAEFLRWVVASHRNMLIVGGTSSGKTTLLSSILMEIPHHERIITAEDTREITLDQPNVVQLEAAPRMGVQIRDLIRLCLRARPDRIVVGEIRGGEAYDFLDALNTGHSGSFCTIHADSAELGLQRLESLIRMSPTAQNLPLADMRRAIASALHYVLFQARVAGVRAPQSIIRLDGVSPDGNYRFTRVFQRRMS